MNTGIFSQAVGFLACAGVVILIALVGLVVLARRSQRGDYGNPVIQPPRATPFEDGDFGGVPTTGAAQEHAAQKRRENIIGSSGFEAQTDEKGPNEED